jgi:hypothetical protein
MAIIYQEDWKQNLQDKLDEPILYEDLCDVVYTDTKILHNPFRDNATASAYTRGAQYIYSTPNMTDDTVNIDTSIIIPEFIDRADLAQTGYDMQMAMSDRQAVAIREALQAQVFASYGQAGTIFQNTDLGGGAGNIVVTGVKRKLRVAKCEELMNSLGLVFIWSPTQFEKVEQFALSNGFVTLDEVKRGGAKSGYRMLGGEHYSSNSLTSNHALAFVKKQITFGICNTTFGDVQVIQDPDRRSGIGITSRADSKAKVWSQRAPAVVDIQSIT